MHPGLPALCTRIFGRKGGLVLEGSKNLFLTEIDGTFANIELVEGKLGNSPLAPKLTIRQAGAVALATPVYFSDFSESLRAFLDRLRRTCMHPDGKTGIQGTPAIGICVAGGGGGGAPACAVSLEGVLATCGFDVVDMVPVRRQNLQSKLEVLRATGKRIACPAFG